MLILGKKIVRPGDVEIPSTLLRWVVQDHGKDSRVGVKSCCA